MTIELLLALLVGVALGYYGTRHFMLTGAAA